MAARARSKTATTRYSFSAQFLRGAAIFARRAHEIEELETTSEDEQAEHRAFVVGAITQATASLETKYRR